MTALDRTDATQEDRWASRSTPTRQGSEVEGCVGPFPVPRGRSLTLQITFFDPDAGELTPQRKGHLFERFAKRLVELSGYADVVLRAKHSSLEYDLEGRSRLHGRRLNGEAKAHEANISGKDAAAFVGKMLPIALAEGSADGLFISTSPFTAEGRDYLDTILNSDMSRHNLNLRTLVGEDIPKFLAENDRCTTEKQLRRGVRDATGMEPVDTWLVVSERADFLLATCGPTATAAATHFVTFNLHGSREPLQELALERLRSQVADLAGLMYVDDNPMPSSESVAERLPTVAAGVGWFDYKFPSPPETFIGRAQPLAEIGQLVATIQAGDTAVRAVQILSRSGVGKSSLLLKVPHELQRPNAVIIDGRNLRVPADIRLVVTELVGKVHAATGTTLVSPAAREDVQPALRAVGEALADVDDVAVILIDQFEALLALPSVFQAVVDMIATTTTWRLPIVWILARKNDLAATYDEGAAIDLPRLNDLSAAIGLDDFTPTEEKVLLERLGVELGGQLTKNLAEAIQTFAAGFPWLLKRVCAHVLTTIRDGLSQRELLQAGLRAEDLFEEDLTGLPEQDKAMLRLLAAHMPNTAAELTRRLEGEVSAQRLTEKLNDFLGRKLLRLSGDVYDTYNDVFKTYLVTERIPFQSRYVFRVTPGATLALLPLIAANGTTDLGTFQSLGGGNKIAVLNKLRELRLLGFIDPKPGVVALSSGAQSALENDTLGEFLRKALRANGLVVSVLDLLSSQGSVTISVVVGELRQELPHIEASDATWVNYASNLVNWLRYAGLVDLEGELVRLRDSASDEQLHPREFYLGSFAPGTFLPSVRPARVLDLLKWAGSGSRTRDEATEEFGGTSTAGLLRDASSLNLIRVSGDSLSLTAQAKAMLTRPDLSEREIAALALSKPNVRALVEAASEQPQDLAAQRDILRRFGSANWTDGTWKWRLGLLSAWVVATGQMKAGRRGLRVAAESTPSRTSQRSQSSGDIRGI